MGFPRGLGWGGWVWLIRRETKAFSGAKEGRQAPSCQIRDSMPLDAGHLSQRSQESGGLCGAGPGLAEEGDSLLPRVGVSNSPPATPHYRDESQEHGIRDGPHQGSCFGGPRRGPRRVAGGRAAAHVRPGHARRPGHAGYVRPREGARRARPAGRAGRRALPPRGAPGPYHRLAAGAPPGETPRRSRPAGGGPSRGRRAEKNAPA